MGLNGLGLARLHIIEHETGLYVLRGVVVSHHDWRRWWFTADGHVHGWYDRCSNTHGLVDDAGHTQVCEWLFGNPVTGEPPRPRDDSWGRICHGMTHRHSRRSVVPIHRWHCVTPASTTPACCGPLIRRPEP